MQLRNQALLSPFSGQPTYTCTRRGIYVCRQQAEQFVQFWPYLYDIDIAEWNPEKLNEDPVFKRMTNSVMDGRTLTHSWHWPCGSILCHGGLARVFGAVGTHRSPEVLFTLQEVFGNVLLQCNATCLPKWVYCHLRHPYLLTTGGIASLSSNGLKTIITAVILGRFSITISSLGLPVTVRQIVTRVRPFLGRVHNLQVDSHTFNGLYW